MADQEVRIQRIAQAKQALAQLVSTDRGTLTRDDLGSKLSFEEASESIDRLLEPFRQLQGRSIEALPTNQLERVIDTCSQVQSLLGQVASFSVETGNPSQARKQLLAQIRDHYDRVYEVLLLPLAFTAAHSTDYSRLEREAQGHLTRMEEAAGAFQRKSDELQKASESALAAIQKQAAQAGVSTQGVIFHQEAELHGTHANRWLIATAVSTALLLAASGAVLVSAFYYTPETTAQAVQLGIAKLVAVSVLFTSVLWCARVYKAHKHNQTVNKHRENALLTFRAFVEGTADPRVKDAILIQAAQAAFSGRPTGFNSSQPESAAIPHPVVDVLGRHLQAPDK